MAPTREQRDRASKGIRARQEAIATLIQNHQEEFDRLHAQNRVAQGLPPRSSGASAEELAERIRKHEERVEKWKAELALVQ